MTLTFFPVFFAIYYLVLMSGSLLRRFGAGPTMTVLVLLGGSAWLLATSPVAGLIPISILVTLAMAGVITRTRTTMPLAAQVALGLSIGASVAFLGVARFAMPGSIFAFSGMTVLVCQEIALVVDLYRGVEGPLRPLFALAHLLQFPVLPGGPLMRYHESLRQWGTPKGMISLGAFAYGMRRVTIGLMKLVGIAYVLSAPVDAIFRLPAARLSTDAAWLAAICLTLQIYFTFSGYADIAIGLGRMLGLRYPENFHRPYLADSVREFWRRWHVTSITWLRDYLAFPIAGRDTPMLRLGPNILLGFLLLGFWYGGGSTVFAWAAYSSAFLALEAVGLDTLRARWPKALQRAYVLLVVSVGWTLLRAGSLASAGLMLKAMVGLSTASRFASPAYLTPSVWLALIVGVIGAGPMIPSISRWRVSVDALTASLAMMGASVWLLLWRGRLLLPARPSKD